MSEEQGRADELCRLYDEFNTAATQERQLQFRLIEWQKVEDNRAQNVRQQRAIGRIQSQLQIQQGMILFGLTRPRD